MKKSTAMFILGVFIILLDLGFLLGGFVLMGESVNKYDEWVKDPNRKPGENIVVTGKLSEKDRAIVQTEYSAYEYKFEGSDVPFYSADNIGKAGDTVTVEIEILSDGLPMAKSKFELGICWVPAGICLILGSIILIYGFKVKKRESKWVQIYYPPPVGYPPQQLPPQYPQPPQPPDDPQYSHLYSPHQDYYERNDNFNNLDNKNFRNQNNRR